MPLLPTSLTEISTEFPVLAAGTYPARIVESTMGKSSKSQVDMLILQYEVRDEENNLTVKIWEYYTFQTREGKVNEAGLRQLKRLIVALFGEDTANDPNFDTDNLKDLDCQVVVKQVTEKNQNDEDELRNRITRVMAA